VRFLKKATSSGWLFVKASENRSTQKSRPNWGEIHPASHLQELRRGVYAPSILYWDLTLHKYRILGVVKGYRPESAKIDVNGQQMDTQYMVNSGILVGYLIEYVNQAIEADDKQP
jgi:hypothetical protein